MHLPPVYIDTETTGLDPADNEIIEIAILDEDENILLDSLVNPYKKTEWPEAQAVNGISPEMVKHAPQLQDIEDQIIDAIVGRTVYIWNKSFDEKFIGWALQYADQVICAMYEYGDFIERTQPQNKSESGRYALTRTASDLGVTVEGDAHRAKHDVIKTIRVRKAWMETNRTDLSGNINTAPYKT